MLIPDEIEEPKIGIAYDFLYRMSICHLERELQYAREGSSFFNIMAEFAG